MLEKLKLKYSKKPLKGDMYNLRNLKVLTDEILLDFMTKGLNLKLNNLYTDFQLGVGIISTIVASLLAYLSMTYEFQEYKVYLIWCLGIYFFLNGIVYFCDMFRSTTYHFTQIKNDKVVIELRVCTDITPPNPVYTILVYRNNKLIPDKLSKSVFELFTKEGVLRSTEFLEELNVFFNK